MLEFNSSAQRSPAFRPLWLRSQDSLLVVGVVAAVSLCGCDDAAGPGDQPAPAVVPVEGPSDPIPWATLGSSGQIALHRTDAVGAHVVILDLHTQTARQLDHTVAADGSRLARSGEALAFSAYSPFDPDTPGAAWDIWVADADGGTATRQTSHDGLDQAPVWSSIPNELVYQVSDGAGVEIRKLRLGSSRADEPLATVPIVESPVDVGLSGTLLFYGNDGGQATRSGLYALAPGAAEPTPLAPGSATAHAPVWSPDESRIAYLELGEDDSTRRLTRLWVAEADGTEPYLLAELTAEDAGPQTEYGGIRYPSSVAWSPDGERIVFNHLSRNLTASVWVVGSDGEGLTRITTQQRAMDGSLSWIP